MRLVLMAGAVALMAGCTPKIGIVRPRPAAVNLAPARRVVVTVSGRDHAAGEPPLSVGQLLASAERNDPQYPIRTLQNSINRSMQGGYFTLTTADSAQCGVHLKVTDWSHGEEQYVPEKSNENPHPATSVKVTGRLEAQASIACGHLGAQPILRAYSIRKELPLLAQTVTVNDHEKLIDLEVAQLTSRVVSEITPATYAEQVELDDSDDAVAPAVERMRVGEFDRAYELLEAVVGQQPSSAAAHYNLGVIEETRGELDKARSRYTEAKRLRSKAIDDAGLARVNRVAAEMQALHGAH